MKSTNFSIYFLVLTLMLIALTGCGPAQAESLPGPTPVPVEPVQPSQAPEPSPSPLPRATPSAAAPTPIPSGSPTPATVVHPQNGWKGWQVYTNPDYGFSFQYPPEWTVKPGKGTMVGRSVLLVPNTTSLAQVVVSFKHTDEDAFIGRTGLGGGDLINCGRVLFLGKESDRLVLVSEGKHMTILYRDLTRGDLAFDIAVDYLGNWTDAAAIPEDVEANADAIVASFALDHPFTPTLTDGDAGKTIMLKQGQTLAVTLEGNLTTGYNWVMDPAENPILKQLGEPEAVPESDLLGAPALITLKFEAIKAGQTGLKLVYRQPWEKTAAPEKTFEATVVIN